MARHQPSSTALSRLAAVLLSLLALVLLQSAASVHAQVVAAGGRTTTRPYVHENAAAAAAEPEGPALPPYTERLRRPTPARGEGGEGAAAAGREPGDGGDDGDGGHEETEAAASITLSEHPDSAAELAGAAGAAFGVDSLMLALMGDEEGSQEALEQGLRANPRSVDLLLQLGDLQMQKRNILRAREYLEDALYFSCNSSAAVHESVFNKLKQASALVDTAPHSAREGPASTSRRRYLRNTHEPEDCTPAEAFVSASPAPKPPPNAQPPHLSASWSTTRLEGNLLRSEASVLAKADLNELTAMVLAAEQHFRQQQAAGAAASSQDEEAQWGSDHHRDMHAAIPSSAFHSPGTIFEEHAQHASVVKLRQSLLQQVAFYLRTTAKTRQQCGNQTFAETDPEARFVRVCRSEVRIKSISAHVLREGELLPAQPAPQDLVRGFLALAVSDTNINSNFVYFNDPRPAGVMSTLPPWFGHGVALAWEMQPGAFSIFPGFLQGSSRANRDPDDSVVLLSFAMALEPLADAKHGNDDSVPEERRFRLLDSDSVHIDAWPTQIMRDMDMIPHDRVFVLNENLRKLALLYEADENSVDKSNKVSTVSTVSCSPGGWQSRSNFFEREDDDIAELRTYTYQMVHKYLTQFPDMVDSMRGALEIDIHSSWIGVNRRHDYNSPHVHPDSTVYYISTGTSPTMPTPREHATLLHFDPRPQAGVWAESGFVAPRVEQSHPRDGMFVIFPSWLEHMVTPHLSEEPRIMVAFNAHVRQREDVASKDGHIPLRIPLRHMDTDD